MALAMLFREACHTIMIGSWALKGLIPSRTQNGSARVLALTSFPFAILLSLNNLFLPRRSSEVVTDEDNARFNSYKEELYLIYRGVCMRTSGYLLSIRGEEASQLSRVVSYPLCIYGAHKQCLPCVVSHN
jgi:hypothetical protein